MEDLPSFLLKGRDVEGQLLRALRASRDRGDSEPTAVLECTSPPETMEIMARSWVNKGWSVDIEATEVGNMTRIRVRKPVGRGSAALSDRRRDHRNPEAPLLPASEAAAGTQPS